MMKLLQPSVQDRFRDRLVSLENKDLLRSLKNMGKREGNTIGFENKTCLNLSSNDYLGLSTDTALCEKFYAGMDKENMIHEFGLGSSSSRLLTGNSDMYEDLEKKLCRFYDLEAALVFNSGYHANIGIIPALTGRKDLILSDALNHASIVDGIRLSKADCIIFKHNDMSDLAILLENNRANYETVLIITESVFSMEGDLADIKALVRLKESFDTLLYVDEAHSVGIYGAQGQGLCYEGGVHDKVDILLGTMGKALASHGAYVLTSRVLKNYLINQMRSLLYTTALPPVAVNWNRFIIQHMNNFSEHRKKLFKVSTAFRKALEKKNIPFLGQSHIIPVITKNNAKAVALSMLLIDHGFLVFPIRPPTVPENQSRIRFSLTSDIEYKDIERVPDLILSCLRD
jgi:8-amino-7-oxononanoate synthase